MLPIHCPSSIAGLSITALQCLNLLSAANEVSSPTPYSKFGPQTSSATALPSRSAMLLIYAPAAVTSAAFFGVAPATNGREALVAAMLFAHFGKRVLEVLFVHVYSGAADGRISAFIGTFYALVAALICKMQATVPASLYAAPAATTVLPAALALFVVGQAGNLYHHRLLAKLRTNSKSTLSTQVPPTSTTPSAMQEVPASKKQSAYVLPVGGLFDYCTMPHYLFEIIAWAGLALVTMQLNAFLVCAGMASYLSGRSVATTHWYKSKLGDVWPAQRRHLVPFVF